MFSLLNPFFTVSWPISISVPSQKDTTHPFRPVLEDERKVNRAPVAIMSVMALIPFAKPKSNWEYEYDAEIRAEYIIDIPQIWNSCS
jgi:hypothetical protein